MKIPRQYCGSIAAILRQYCAITAAVLWQYCGNTAAILQQYCGSTAGPWERGSAGPWERGNAKIDFSKGVPYLLLKNINLNKGVRAFCFGLVSEMSQPLRASADFELLPNIKSLKC